MIASRLKSLVVALSVVCGGIAPCWAQARTEEPYFVSLSGIALEDLTVAWLALQAQYEPETSLRDFWISYTRTGHDPAIIEFRLGPRHERLPDGSVHLDPRVVFYRVTVEGAATTIEVIDPAAPLTPVP